MSRDSWTIHLDVHPWTEPSTAPPPRITSDLGPARRPLLALGPDTGRGHYRIRSERNYVHVAPADRPSPGDGAGETIALIEAYHDPYITSDLQTFDQAYGLPNPTLTVDDLAGAQTNEGWALEESLDVEWAHAIAPAANILVVEANSQTLNGLITAVNVARNTPGVVAISMSWGFNEFHGEAAYNSTFTTPPGHTGITFLAASGDSGQARGPEWPSSAPTVVAVGGTTLFIDNSGRISARGALGRQ